MRPRAFTPAQGHTDNHTRGDSVAAIGRRLSPAILVLSRLLAVLAAASFSSIIFAALGMPSAVCVPGRFLLSSFSWASFFVPLYLLCGALLLTARVFRRRSTVLLMLSIIPFLTLSLILRVLQSPTSWIPLALVDSFGVLPSALLLFLLLALEVIFLLSMPRGVPEPPRRTRRPAPKPLALPLISSDEPVEAMLPPPPQPEAEVFDPSAQSQPQSRSQPADPPQPAAVPRRPPEPAVIPAPAREQAELPFPAETGGKAAYGIPVHHVLKNRGDNEYWVVDDETKRAARILTDSLREFNIEAEVTGIRKGPVITLFEVLPAPGVRVSKIANLADNIALRLAAPSVRIVAPIPGRHAVGIEVPNRARAIVSFKEMISLDLMQKSPYEIPLALGKDILGEAQVIDLVQTPHLLIGGATNSGKSVLVNSIICSILFRKSPDEVRLFLIDPKIVELKLYNGCPHLLTPVITEPKKAFQALQYCISEMERRYTLLDALGVRDIRAFNKKAKKERVQRLPYIVIVIDEFADLMATTGKELESTLARLAAMARAIGIHMVLATQRPSIDVITGLIKANIPSRIAFMVANKFDSRIIIDAVGAEKLLGKGDMLFSAAWNPFPTRIQGAYIDDEEIDAVTDYVKKLGPPQYIDEEVFFDDEETGDFEGEPGNDPLFEQALDIVIAQGKASASYLQRRLKVGYNRAARLVEEMEMRGIVGPAQGSKPREIIHVPSKGGT
jgi:DNA segregation ATPase FtsK/SpoIIIE, S-DNA-T family